MVNLENIDGDSYEPGTLEQLINLVEAAPAPGSDSMVNKDTGIMEIIARGDSNFPTPMVMQKMQEAQYCFVYDRWSGDRSIVNMNLLRTQLLKLCTDVDDPHFGQRVFTTIKPDVEIVKGSLPCRLNKNHPDREDLGVFGFPFCPKSDLNSPYDVDTHMKRRHKQELATLEYEKTEAKERDDREFQRTLLLRNTNVIGAEGLQLTADENEWRYSETCKECGWVTGSKVSIAAKNKLDRHIRERHSNDTAVEREADSDPESSGAPLDTPDEEVSSGTD